MDYPCIIFECRLTAIISMPTRRKITKQIVQTALRSFSNQITDIFDGVKLAASRYSEGILASKIGYQNVAKGLKYVYCNGIICQLSTFLALAW